MSTAEISDAIKKEQFTLAEIKTTFYVDNHIKQLKLRAAIAIQKIKDNGYRPLPS